MGQHSRLQCARQVFFWFFLLSALSVPSAARQRTLEIVTDSTRGKGEVFDTSIHLQGVKSDPFHLMVTSLEIEPLRLQPLSSVNPQDLPAYFRLSLAAPLPSSPWEWSQRMNFSGYWRDDLARARRYQTYYMILNSIEAGGAAYLIYRHISKYGFK